MKATFLKEIPTVRSTMEVFGGYDHRARIAEGSLFDECNLSSRDYPVMSTRRERIKLADIEGLQGVHVKDSVAWVANGRLYYDGQEVPELILSEGEKQLVSMGSRIIIYPDMVSYDTVKGECERLYHHKDFEGVDAIVCVGDYALGIKSAQWYSSLPQGKPLNSFKEEMEYTPSEGAYAYYIKKNTQIFYQYTDGAFVPVVSNLIVAEYVELGEDLNYTLSNELQEKKGKKILLFSSKGEFCLANIVEVDCNLEHYYSSYNGMKTCYRYQFRLETERAFSSEELATEWDFIYPDQPLFDGVQENGNRLWGWRYGENIQGDFVNEIYASEMGKPSEWMTFEGSDADSYSVTVGSDGPFTGATYWGGSLYFFKETCFHRIMGSLPSNFQLVTVSCNGVEAGSERSLVVAGDAMYYKGVDGIYCYDGSIPYKISDVFGDRKYKNAVGGVLGDRIFFDMESEDGGRVLFVYDIAKKMWHVEGGIGAMCFVSAYGNLMAASRSGLMLLADDAVDEVLTRLFGESMVREGAFSWFAEFGDFGLSDPDAKYVSKLLLRMTVDEGARMTVEVMCDSDGSWRTAAVVSAKNKKSWCLPVVTPRCDHFRLRLSGVGGFQLWTLTRETESTNEIR